MTPLAEILIRQIARDGPISVADYMAACLHHPQHGYYATRDPLGAAGDFITAPEISQMFGELMGLALAQAWIDQGAPNRAVLAELGPGRGTLMADVLRATARVPGFHEAMQLCLVESSPVLRAAQADRLGSFDPVFVDQAGDLPDGPLFLLANEFFDALPVRQFQRGAAQWHERMIGLGDGRLVWGLSPEKPVAALDARLADTVPGQIVETCAPAEAIASEIGRRIATFGGAAIIVDYGDSVSIGDTFQAVAGHAYADPLAAPGAADLTAHVAFAPLIAAAAPADGHGPVPQGVVLERLGIAARADALAARLGGADLSAHLAAHRRLTHPDEMGNLFKVIGLTPTGAPAPPGLEPA
ncbi:class I SAM-dependent methyltransferase [Rhodobacterales bacterium HKCCE3408]|nr:class I SAM-dependent methyltransferase [Rhodobacterales bacterium HKCCE3408]